jgi:hypothetical protein
MPKTPKAPSAGARKAQKNERMIEVKLRFFTNKIADNEGEVIPKNAWAAGFVRMEKNETHGISPKSPLPFGSLLDVGAVIEKVLINHGIVLHPSTKMKRYFTE